jgi:hypothetical protein
MLSGDFGPKRASARDASVTCQSSNHVVVSIRAQRPSNALKAVEKAVTVTIHHTVHNIFSEIDIVNLQTWLKLSRPLARRKYTPARI